MIYLDYAAHTPVNKDVLDAFNEVTLKYIANPNASHTLGQEAKKRIDEATQHIAKLLEVKPTEIIYTSGATEANNLAIKGVVGHYKRGGKHVITTYLEHSSVTSPIAALQREGYEVDFVDLLPSGEVDMNHLKELLRQDTAIVSIAYVDSEIGTIQPVQQIGELLKDYPKCFFHVDATQAVGKVPVSFEGVDLVTMASHKLYGINGCGILIKKDHVMLEPLMHGGVSTTHFRSGTPTIGLIVATEKALELAKGHEVEAYQYVKKLNKQVREGFKGYDQVLFNSTEKGSPYILNISFRGINAAGMQEALARDEVYVATKSACCTLNTPSRPVYALTKDRKRALSTLRVSLSHLTTEEEIEAFLVSFDKCYQEMLLK